MDIGTIRARILEGNYLVKSHAIGHALKEGFERQHMVEAVMNGRIIEEYPGDRRSLICGTATLAQAVSIYLHVVCEWADPVYVEFVTAYVPDELQWGNPPFRRRSK